MSILQIITMPNKKLQRRCSDVVNFDHELHTLLDNMKLTLEDANGLGLAAPQVGKLVNVCLVLDEDNDKIYEIINPEILETTGEVTDVEGCLSIPETFGIVVRPYSIKIRASDRNGKLFYLEADDYFARIIFHEIDHLRGKLFTDIANEILDRNGLTEYLNKQKRIIFMGTPQFSVPILNKIVAENYSVVAIVTQPDRPVGRKKIITPSPVKAAAIRLNIPVLQPERIKDPKSIKEVLDYEPDIIITAAYGQIVPPEILNFPNFKAINVHASLLPKYRGGAPIQHALINGETETGITIIYMTNKLDAGAMLAKKSLPITREDNVATLHEKLSDLGASLLSETLPKIFSDEISPREQDVSKATFAPNIKRENEQIIWANTSEQIYNQVRGLSPWPVAYTTLNKQTIKIRQCQKVTLNQKKTYEVGEIVQVEGDGFIVATGDSEFIKITNWQIAGKKPMQPTTLSQSGHPFLNGEKFV